MNIDLVSPLFLNRSDSLFVDDLVRCNEEIKDIIRSSSFLVIGAAGSIGSSVASELFMHNPRKLHLLDINENNMVELVRRLRSTVGYFNGEFKTFIVDSGDVEAIFLYSQEGPYDFVFNLSALKHVRSERDPYTLMRMVKVNILNTLSSLKSFREFKLQKYFAVSTDKAANPINLMGASKRIMEIFLMNQSEKIPLSLARFANVAFSNGSLLEGFVNRFENLQPISAPLDIKRYFITPKESAELCLFSALLGENRDIFFPKYKNKLQLISFYDLTIKFLNFKGYDIFECQSEEEARSRCSELIAKKKWPCFFFKSDTTGEKDFEEFHTNKEIIDMKRFENIGIIKNSEDFNIDKLDEFTKNIDILLNLGKWTKQDIVEIFNQILPDFQHKETGKYLDQRM